MSDSERLDKIENQLKALQQAFLQSSRNESGHTIPRVDESYNKIPQINNNTAGVNENDSAICDVAELSDENSYAIEDLAEIVDDLLERVEALEEK